MALANADEVAAVVSLHGELDLTTVDGLRGVTTEVVRSGYRSLVLDLTDVAFMDTHGVRALVDAQRTMQSSGGSVVVRNPGEAVRRLLEVGGVVGLVSVEIDPAEIDPTPLPAET